MTAATTDRHHSHRWALVLGTVDERAVPWQLGVIAGLADLGLDPRDATLIMGVSAGALVGES